MHQCFLSFKMYIFNSLGRSCPWIKMCDLRKNGKKREKDKVLLYDPFHTPVYQCLFNNEKVQLPSWIRDLSSNWASLLAPPLILISSLIFKIYRMHSLPKVSGYLYDSNFKQHKEVNAPCPKASSCHSKVLFQCTLKSGFYTFHWRSFKQFDQG